MNNKQKVLSALIEKPSTYTIDVIDNSMLPEDKKEKKEIVFKVKPPSIGVLAICADIFQELPEELLKPEAKITMKETLPYTNQMIKVICRIAHGKQDDYPDWHEAFFKANTTPQDIFGIFHETALKTQSDFFLTSFQIASLTNPMMMRNPKNLKDLTPFS